MRVGYIAVLMLCWGVGACEVRIAPATERASARDTASASGDIWDGWLTVSLGERSGGHAGSSDGSLQRAVEDLRALRGRDLDAFTAEALDSILSLMDQVEGLAPALSQRIREAATSADRARAAGCSCRCRVSDCRGR